MSAERYDAPTFSVSDCVAIPVNVVAYTLDHLNELVPSVEILSSPGIAFKPLNFNGVFKLPLTVV